MTPSRLVQCSNCGEKTTEEQADKNAEILQTEQGDWCSPECYLSYRKAQIPLYQFWRLRSTISDAYGRSLRENPPKTQLRSWGGPLTQDAYHGREEKQTAHSTGPKRVISHIK